MVLIFEHALLGIKWMINWIVQDVNADVRHKIELRKIKSEKIFGKLLTSSGVEYHTKPLKRMLTNVIENVKASTEQESATKNDERSSEEMISKRDKVKVVE